MTLSLGAAVALFDREGRVLLVRHTYGARNWEFPGGGALDGEDPAATAARELREETGLDAELGRLTGVYVEPGDSGGAVHFVFRVHLGEEAGPTPSSPEVDATEFWLPAQLPRPLSDFTALRIADASSERVAYAVIRGRRWL